MYHILVWHDCSVFACANREYFFYKSTDLFSIVIAVRMLNSIHLLGNHCQEHRPIVTHRSGYYLQAAETVWTANELYILSMPATFLVMQRLICAESESACAHVHEDGSGLCTIQYNLVSADPTLLELMACSFANSPWARPAAALCYFRRPHYQHKLIRVAGRR